MPPIKVTASTMGVSTPATVSEDAGTGYYHFKRDPSWKPGDPRYREGEPGTPYRPAAKKTAARAERLARYCALRLEGKTKAEAGDLLGVHESTSRQYEREFRDRQREERRDG